MRGELKIWNTLLDILFPPACLACGTHLPRGTEKPLCTSCQASIIHFDSLFCPICRARLADGVKICHAKALYMLAAAGSYQNPALQRLIWQLKFGHRRPAAKLLADQINTYVRQLPITIQDFVMIPVPLHKARERQRGFNQSLLIAEQLQTLLGVPVIQGTLVKINPTTAQSELPNWDLRKQNLTDCFRVIKPELITGKQILLIDDVSTSGTTLTACAQELRRAGAKKIIGLVAARA